MKTTIITPIKYYSLLVLAILLSSCSEDDGIDVSFVDDIININVNESYQLELVTEGDISNATWTSEHPEIASIDSDGKVKGHMGGTTVVTVLINSSLAFASITVEPDVYIAGEILENGFNTLYNPNLTCIEVDNATYSNTNWIDKDSQSYFSNDCMFSSCGEVLNILDNTLITSAIYPNPIKNTLHIEANQIITKLTVLTF